MSVPHSGHKDLDLIRVYLDGLRSTPLLTADEEVQLSKRIEAGLYAAYLIAAGATHLNATAAELQRIVSDGKAAEAVFTRANLRLVVSIARSYARYGMPLLDAIQEGNLGLIHAAQKFDFRQGIKFSTYATWWIRQSITRAFPTQERTIRIPVNVGDELKRMRAAALRLEQQGFHDPEDSSLATAMNVPTARIRDLRKWSTEPVSLDFPVGDDASSVIGGLIVDDDQHAVDDEVIANLDHERVGAALYEMDERLSKILRARFGFAGHRQSIGQVAQDLGLSRERVRQLEKRALQVIAVAMGIKVHAAG